MKVLYCYRYGILGGVCTQLWNRLTYLQGQAGWEFQLLFSRDYGVSNYFDPSVKLRFGLEPSALPTLIADEKFDIVVIVDTPEYFEAVAAQPRNFLLIAEIHATNRRSLEHLKSRTWEPDLFVVPSDYMKRLLINEYNVEESQIRIVSNSIDTDLFQKVSPPSIPIRPVLLWVGKIDDHKDWRALLKISQKLAMRGREFEIWCVGGATCAASRAEEFLATAEELEVLSRFRWLDRVENAVMPTVYSAVAAGGGCALITSHDESFGMSLLESLCCGCPTVATKVGALPELNIDPRLVRFFELGDHDAAVFHLMDVMAPGAVSQAQEAYTIARPELVKNYHPRTAGVTYAALLSAPRQ